MSEALQNAQAQLILMRAQINSIIDTAINQIALVEEENRRLVRASLQVETHFYSEAEAAGRMGMKPSTLQKKRLAGEVEYTALTSDVRYTEENLRRNAELHKRPALTDLQQAQRDEFATRRERRKAS